MLEFERNSPIDTAVLADFFARCGWTEAGAGTKLEWVLAASEEWVVCKLDGELIGFGRSCRLGPVRRVVCDVLVDPRLPDGGLRLEIVRLLSENAGSMEEVSVFTERQAYPLGGLRGSHADQGPAFLPAAPPGAYLGRQSGILPASNEAEGRGGRDE